MNELPELQALFESEAMALPYGEDISIRTHMLQCAELAVAEALPDALIAAALLHDIGWALGEEHHEDAGAERLAALFGDAVALPVRMHVAAKRYLVTMEPGYADQLSAESRRTLLRQGGPFTPEQCAIFARQSGFPEAIALRRLDDSGKEKRPPTSQFGDYIELLRHLLA